MREGGIDIGGDFVGWDSGNSGQQIPFGKLRAGSHRAAARFGMTKVLYGVSALDASPAELDDSAAIAFGGAGCG